MNEQNRVWLYGRSAKNKKSTIERQISQLKTYAEQKGYQVVGSSYDVDSGLNFDRDGLDIIKTVAATGKIDIVLTTEIAQVGRSMVGVMEFMKTLKNYGVDVITLDMEDTLNEAHTLDVHGKSDSPIAPFNLNKSINEISKINFNDSNFYSTYEIAEILGVVDVKTGRPSAEAIEAIIGQLNLPLVEGVDYIKKMEMPQKSPTVYTQASVPPYSSTTGFNLPF